MEMNLTKTKIYKVIANGSREDILKVSREYLRPGRDPNLRHPVTGGNILHHIVDNAAKFSDPEMLTVVYTLACVRVEVDARDVRGDTALHGVVRQQGAHRIMVALLRCGIDTSIQNYCGQTAEDILHEERPYGYEEMTHWYLKFKPGLWCELNQDEPDLRSVKRLLDSWCRLNTVKNGRFVRMVERMENTCKRQDLIELLKKHEHTVELVTALLAGWGLLVRKWIKDGTLFNFDVNIRDASYQVRYPDFVAVPQSLLAATWQTNSLEAVHALMELGPDVSVLQISPPECVSEPLIFQIFKSIYRPKSASVVQKIVESSDLSIRNCKGETLLFKAFINEEPLSIIQRLFDRNINVGARDIFGRTARDVTKEMDKPKYTRAIDDYVIQLVRQKNFNAIEKLLLDGYDHVVDIADASGRSLENIAKKFASDQVYEIIQKGNAIQAHIGRIFEAVEKGNLNGLYKLLSCKKYASGLDVCGRSPLLKAILKGRRGVVMKLITDFPFIINIQDTLGRSALHYAFLFLDDTDMIELLLKHGANPYLKDWSGREPQSYKQTVCGVRTFCQLKRQVLDAELDVYLYRTNFGQSLHEAILDGNLLAVKRLVSGLEGLTEVSRYSHFLFETVDLCREDIAMYLILSGFKTDIFKTYIRCNPCTSACAVRGCDRQVVSLRQRAVRAGCGRVLRLINSLTHTSNGFSSLDVVPGYHVSQLTNN